MGEIIQILKNIKCSRKGSYLQSQGTCSYSWILKYRLV